MIEIRIYHHPDDGNGPTHAVGAQIATEQLQSTTATPFGLLTDTSEALWWNLMDAVPELEEQLYGKK